MYIYYRLHIIYYYQNIKCKRGRTISMKIITLNDLSKAISNRMDVDVGRASRTAEFILDLFGYDDRIIDNYLNPEDRQLFYILEEEGMLVTGREETILYDGRSWRTHYWQLKKNTILKYAMEKNKKEESLHTKKQAQDAQNKDIYNTLSEDAWEKRKIEFFTTGI